MLTKQSMILYAATHIDEWPENLHNLPPVPEGMWWVKLDGQVVLNGPTQETKGYNFVVNKPLWQSARQAEKTTTNCQENPDSSKWDGEGLPPVGVVVELSRSHGHQVSLEEFDIFQHGLPDLWADGDELTVLAHAKMHGIVVAVVQNNNALMVSSIIPSMIRPIRTERELFIEKSTAVMIAVPEGYKFEALAAAMYDAGARFSGENDE